MVTERVPNVDFIPLGRIRDRKDFMFSITEADIEMMAEKYGLSPGQQTALFLVFVKGLSRSEAARSLGIKRQSFHDRLTKAGRRIEKQWKPEEAEPDISL